MTVTDQNGGTKTCYQNMYGLNSNSQHGASYPAATRQVNGDVGGNDQCMSVGVVKQGQNVNGWYQNGNGRDCPRDDAVWPNTALKNNCFLAVWIK